MTTSLTKSKYLLLAVALAVSGESLTAQTQGLHPLIVVDSEGTLPAPVATEFLNVATRATSAAILKSTARGFYASDIKLFSAAKPFRGQVEMLADILHRLDQNILNRNLNLKVRGKGQHTVRYRLFWTGSNEGISPISGNILDLLLKSFVNISHRLDVPTPITMELGESIFKTRFATGTSGLETALRQETAENYDAILAMKTDVPVWPLHIFIEFVFDGEKGTQANLRFLFGSVSLAQGKKDMGTAILDKFIYSPMKKGQGVFEFSLSRNYPLSGVAPGDPTAIVTFGTLDPETLRPKSCVADECSQWLDSLPTMYMHIDPKDSSWFTRTKAWLASFDSFQIMFKSIAINLKDRSIAPEHTGMIFYIDAYTGGSKVIDMKDSKPKNWFEAFVQRKGAIEGQIVPAFDAAARKSLDDMMKVNLDSLIFRGKKPEKS